MGGAAVGSTCFISTPGRTGMKRGRAIRVSGLRERELMRLDIHAPLNARIKNINLDETVSFSSPQRLPALTTRTNGASHQSTVVIDLQGVAFGRDERP